MSAIRFVDASFLRPLNHLICQDDKSVGIHPVGRAGMSARGVSMDAQTQFLLDYDGGSLRESTRFIVCVEVPVNFRLQRFAKTSAYRILGPNRNSGTVSLIGHLQQWVFPGHCAIACACSDERR
jgi:hypothetical protein